MKQKLISLSTLMAFVLLFFTGCQKEIQQKEDSPLTDENSLQSRINDDDGPGCQLKHVDYGGGYTLDFKYNNKGLASEVLLAYSDGYFEQHQIFYDRRNRLVKTRVTSTYFPTTIFDFSHSGGLITRANGYFEETNEPWRDIRYSYNRKGQMTNLDDVLQDVHTKFFYNNQGYNKRGELYLGADLYFTYEYEFKIPNRNPFLAVNGVPFGFWSFTLPLWDKRWENNDRVTIYEEGSPTVILDTDPAQTTMTTGSNNYLTSATKYDRISESFYTESMTYKNCGGKHDNDNDAATSAGKQLKPLSPVAKLQRILNSPSKNIKTQLQELKRQLKK